MIILQYAFALQIGTQVSGIEAAVVTRGLCNVVVTPIDAMKPERDREAAKSMAALAEERVAVG